MTNTAYYKLRTTSSQAGVTLIEVLIYITILGFVMTYALMATYQILSGSRSLNNKNVVEEETGFVMAKLNWALNDVAVINSPAANVSGVTLSVRKNGSVANIVFTLTGDDITIDKGSGPVKLNSDSVVITDLKFEHIQKTGTLTADIIKTSFNANGKLFESTHFIR